MRTLAPLAAPLVLLALGFGCSQSDKDGSADDTDPTGDTGSDDTGDDDTAEDDDTSDDDTADTANPTADVVINEILASNDAAFEDTDNPGEFPDAIELYNAGNATADLGGWTIADDKVTATAPAGVTLAAGTYLVLIADDDTDADAWPHLPFKLGAGGDTVTLKDDGGTPIDEVSWDEDDTDLVFGAQQEDVSIARSPDGSDTWVTDDTPTLGAKNE